MYLADDFAPALQGFDVEELDAMKSTVLGIRGDDTIGFRNTAWQTFALGNHGHDVLDWNGRSVLQAISDVLRPFYADLFARARRERTPLEHEYECPSPSEYRRFWLRVVPLRGRALLLLHHLVDVHDHSGDAHGPSDAVYRDEHGIVTQCAQCRLVRRVDHPSTWDWVPAYVAVRQADLSHGLCPVCFRHYYPELAKKWDAQKR